MQFAAQLFHNGDMAMRFSFSKKLVLREDYTRKDGSKGLYLRIIIERKKKDIPLNIYLSPHQLSQDGQVRDHNYSKEYNMMIGRDLAKANEIFIEHRLAERKLTLDGFLKDFFNYETRHDYAEFVSKRRLQRLKDGDISESTCENHGYFVDKIKEWKPGLKFRDITLQSIKEFDSWLKGRKLSQSSRANNLNFFNAYINIAIGDGYRLENPFLQFKIPAIAKRIIHLSQEQLTKWTEYYFSSDIDPVEKKVSKYFLGMCYTSLRVSDFLAIDKEKNIIGDQLVFIPQKTKKKRNGLPLIINLTETSKFFIMEMEDNPKDRLDPVNINKHLKTIAGKLEIRQNISTHVGRHTFATIFLERGGAVEVLQQILDHSDISDTMIYVHVTNKRKRDQIEGAFGEFYTVK